MANIVPYEDSEIFSGTGLKKGFMLKKKYSCNKIKLLIFTVLLKNSTSLSKFLWSSCLNITPSIASFKSVIFITMPVRASMGPRTVTSTVKKKKNKYSCHTAWPSPFQKSSFITVQFKIFLDKIFLYKLI